MSERYFVERPIEGSQVRLAGSEGQHLAKVMRRSVGDLVTLFDGGGDEFLARIEAVSKKGEVELAIVERRTVDREAAHAVTLAVALPKGDRQQWLVEKLTELGVERLIPLVTRRGVAQPVDAALVRMRRWVVEASKQCGRNRLMEIAPPKSWEELAQQPENSRYFAHIDNDVPPASRFAPLPDVIAIGPEGGWTEEEVALARQHHWTFVGLGPRILRVETAAVAVAVLAISKAN